MTNTEFENIATPQNGIISAEAKGHYYQGLYWNQLIQLKHDIEYLSSYQVNVIKSERILNIVVAAVSAGSLAIWVVLKKVEVLWATLIVLVALINAIRPYLPFGKRTPQIADLVNELQGLFTYAERRWYDVAEGHLDNREIHRLIMELRHQRSQINHSHSKRSPLPLKQKHQHIAAEQTRTFFETHY